MKNTLVFDEGFRRELRELVTEAVAAAFEQKSAEASMLTSSEVMSRFRLSRTSLWRLCKGGILHPRKGKGRQQLFSAAECEAAIVGNK